MAEASVIPIIVKTKRGGRRNDETAPAVITALNIPTVAAITISTPLLVILQYAIHTTLDVHAMATHSRKLCQPGRRLRPRFG